MTRLIAALLALTLLTGGSEAHGIDYELHGSGNATVVFRYSDGSVMAGSEYRVFAPGGNAFPVATGQTDAAGEVPLRADTDGRWSIEVQDGAGHASRARIDVTRGVPALPGQTIPDWFVAISVLLNVLLTLSVIVGWSRKLPFTRKLPFRKRVIAS